MVSWPTTRPSAAFFAVASQAAFLVPHWFWFASDFQRTATFRVLVGLIAISLVFSCRDLRGRVRSLLVFPIKDQELAGMAVLRLAGLTALGIVGFVFASGTAAKIYPMPESIPSAAGELAAKPFGQLITLGFLLFTAIDEEIVFRGAALIILSNAVKNRAIVAIISASAFALCHFNDGHFIFAFSLISGFILAMIVQQGRSLLPTIAASFLVNVWAGP